MLRALDRFFFSRRNGRNGPVPLGSAVFDLRLLVVLLAVLRRRDPPELGSHLTKRKKSYVKEIWGPQEGVWLEYASTRDTFLGHCGPYVSKL